MSNPERDPKPIRELILENVEETIAGIRAESGYHSTILRVNRYQTGPFLEPLPAASIYDLAETSLIGVMQMEERLLTVIIEAHLKSIPERLSTDMNYLLADMILAMSEDITRGYRAIDTVVMDATTGAAKPGKPYGVVQVQFDIHYRYPRGLPYIVDPSLRDAG